MEEGYLALRWNNHNAMFSKNLHVLRAQESYTDVSLACDGKVYSAHKFVLSTCSEYFREMFTKTPCPHPVIFLQNVTRKDLESVMDFMYNGEVHVPQCDLGSLLRTADSLQVKGLAVPDGMPNANSYTGASTSSTAAAPTTVPSVSPANNPLPGATANSNGNSNCAALPVKRKRSHEPGKREDPPKLIPHSKLSSPNKSRTITPAMPELKKIKMESNSPTPALLPHNTNITKSPVKSNGLQQSHNNNNNVPDKELEIKKETLDCDSNNITMKTTQNTYQNTGGEEKEESLNEESKEENEDSTSTSDSSSSTSSSSEDEDDDDDNNEGEDNNEVEDNNEEKDNDEVEDNDEIEDNEPPETEQNSHCGPSTDIDDANEHSNLSLPNSEISAADMLQVDLSEDGTQFIISPGKTNSTGDMNSAESQASSNGTEDEMNKKPFVCVICGHSFTRRDNLANHLKTHTGDKPFMCPYCHKCFSRKDYLKQHERIHTGEKPYACEVCGRAFTRKEGLTDHMRCHSDLKAFACDVCGKTFKQKCGIRFHKRNYKH